MSSEKEISDEIESAIISGLTAHEDWEEGDLLVDWLVVAYTTNADPEKGGSYPMFFANGVMAHYKARGLLQTGLVYLNDVDTG